MMIVRRMFFFGFNITYKIVVIVSTRFVKLHPFENDKCFVETMVCDKNLILSSCDEIIKSVLLGSSTSTFLWTWNSEWIASKDKLIFRCGNGLLFEK